MLPVCLKMLVLLVLTLGATIQHLDAQSVYLEALDLPLAVHYVTYYAMSESTLAVGTFYLPLCSPFKDGQFVEMKGQSRTLARRAPIRQANGDNSLSWNFTAFPVMMPWLSGTYRCYTSTAQSRRTYTLRVIGDCQEYNESLLVPSSPASTHFNTTVMTRCKAGFKLESGADAAYIVCHANRTWSEFPKCIIDAVDCPGACADVHANCTDVRGSYICTCGEGYTGDGSLAGGCIDVTTTRSSTSSSPTLDPLTTRQNTNTASPVDRPTSETPSMTQSTANVQGSETATHGMSHWLPIAIAVPCVIAVIAAAIAILIFAKRRRDLSRKTYSCQHVARDQGATQNVAYEGVERIDIRATRNVAYDPCPADSRQPVLRVLGNPRAVVYEDGEIMENTTRNAAYTLTSVPNQPNYEFIS